MKNPFTFLKKIFGKKQGYTPEKEISEFNNMIKGLYSNPEKTKELVMKYFRDIEFLPTNQFKSIFVYLSREHLADDLAEAACEKVKKDPKLFKELSVGNLGYILDHFGFYPIIDLFDYTVIGNGNNKNASLKLLEEVRATTCWLHYERDESSRRAYIKYFSFGDGKDLLNKKLSQRFLSILNEYYNKFDAKKMVKDGIMSQELFDKIYN